jgi:tetratricopeptide (TPR) repeat protein
MKPYRFAVTVRVSMVTLALTCLVVAAASRLWAQGEPWDKAMKQAEKAYSEGLQEKYSRSLFAVNSPKVLNYFAKSETEFLAALAETRKFPAGDARTTRTLGELADVYLEEQNFVDAEKVGNQSVSNMEASAIPDDPRLGNALINLAMIYASESKPEQAGPVWSRALAILKKSSGSENEMLAHLNAQAHLSITISPACKEQIYGFILALGESAGVPDQDLRATLRDLASVQEGPHAEQTYARMLEIDKKVFGPDGLKTSQDQEALAKLYAEEGKYAASLPLLQLSLEGRLKLAGIAESEYRKSIDHYALLRLHAGNLAKTFYESDLFHLDRAIAEAYAETGKYSEAEESFKNLLASDEADTTSNLVMKNHYLTVDWMSLAKVYREQHRYDDAVDAFKRAEASNAVNENSKFSRVPIQVENVQTGKITVSSSRPPIWVWSIQNELAETYREKGDIAAAEPLFKSSMEMAQLFLTDQSILMPPGNPSLAELLDHYGTLLRDQGKYEEAELLYKRALESWAKSRYPEHPHAVRTLTDYAAMLRQLNRLSEAEVLEERAAVILLKAGTSNPVN